MIMARFFKGIMEMAWLKQFRLTHLDLHLDFETRTVLKQDIRIQSFVSSESMQKENQTSIPSEKDDRHKEQSYFLLQTI